MSIDNYSPFSIRHPIRHYRAYRELKEKGQRQGEPLVLP
jgi:hypothetical protein